MPSILILLAAGLFAGAMNAAAGGGSFISLPALVAAGVPSVGANACSTVALFPGAFASAWAYRKDLGGFDGVSIRALLFASVAGGLEGALLLLFTPQRSFDVLLPWLLLIGAIAFAFGPRAGAYLRQRSRGATSALPRGPLLVSQFVLGIYGGYFGGAVGMMTMAVWSLFGVTNIKAANAARTLLTGSMNAIASVCFIAARIVWWRQTCIMLLAALAGGYFGARLTRRIDPRHLRLGISVFNFVMTGVFFARAMK